VPRVKSGDTRAKIQQVALELFADQGVQNTSLRAIADRLGVTKPALYYHFRSRDDLVASLFQPLIDDLDAYVAEQESLPSVDPRELLESYFDLTYRHRGVIQLVLRDVSLLSRHNLAELFFDWRTRLMALLVGPDPDLSGRTRAMVAMGGLSDCAVMFEEVDQAELRSAAVDAACATLGVTT
jgi:AcrR family transcriptional regulator